MLALRSIFFTFVCPGTVTLLIPYFILRDQGPDYRPFWHYAGALPIGVGAGILFRCIFDFAVVGRGTLAPVDPPKNLVARGLYRYVRNPMYVGVVLILLGEALFFGSIALLWYALGFFGLVHLFVVLYEEPTLRRQFGESYEAYCRTVHRWLPSAPRQPGK
jgi:protein-S-isoprenylcysteine O-methyltransferase Ste14